MLIFPILGVMVADKMDRHRLLIIALVAAAFLSLILAVLVKTGTVEIWHIIILSLLGGVDHLLQSSGPAVDSAQPGGKETPAQRHLAG